MRLRNIPESGEYFEKSPYAVTDVISAKGHWSEIFHNESPLAVEFGCGKGRFITDLSAAYPEINFVGIDKYTSVLYKGLKRIEDIPFRENLRFACVFANDLEDIFLPGELDRIYLNFSDPWPKARHADRRLTSRKFLEHYRKVLAPGGCIEFKTDNRDLFEFSLEEMAESGWTVIDKSFDVHELYAQTPETADTTDIIHTESLTQVRIMTEYEERFVNEGKSICKLIARYDN